MWFNQSIYLNIIHYFKDGITDISYLCNHPSFATDTDVLTTFTLHLHGVSSLRFILLQEPVIQNSHRYFIIHSIIATRWSIVECKISDYLFNIILEIYTSKQQRQTITSNSDTRGSKSSSNGNATTKWSCTLWPSNVLLLCYISVMY